MRMKTRFHGTADIAIWNAETKILHFSDDRLFVNLISLQ